MGSTSERLPSFKGPRDLSLSARGGKREGTGPVPSGDGKARPRRVFTPNIPPKRDRGATSSGTSGDRQSSSSGGKDAVGGVSGLGARGRQQRGRGGGRGAGGGRGFKPRGELVQSESIFSEGIGNPAEAKRSSAMQYKTGYGSSSRYKSDGGPSRVSSMNRSTLKTIIKEEESESDKKIFGEETEVEDEEETEPSNPLVAVSLPLISYVPEFFMEPIILDSGHVPGTSISTENSITEPVIKIKQEKIDDDDPSAPSLVVIKQEKTDEDDEISKANELKKKLAAIPLEPSSFAGTFRSIPPEGTLAYFQLPDELPVLQGNVRNSTDSRDGSKNSAELVQDINDLPDGIIGRLQILSTGRTRFILGENAFDVDPGRPVGFRQELHALNTENKTLVNLGSVNRKFVMTPDISSLLEDGF